MFILRRITSETIEINTCLGTNYVLISREKNKEEFERTTKQWKVDDVTEVYGVVTFNDGEDIMPLYEKSTYYIMTSSGETFSNISNK